MVLQFRREFLNISSVDPFASITIAAVCHKIFRTHILKANTIGIVPQDGYVGRKKQQSRKDLQWMAWLAHRHRIDIVNASSLQGEAKVGRYFVDGICHSNKTIYEFHGCYFHGCPKCFSPRLENSRKGCHMGDLYSTTLDKEKDLQALAPEYSIVTMWECEFNKLLNMDTDMATFVTALDVPVPLNPRDAFYGGRTHASRLYAKVEEGEVIRYYDFVSLYPTINKFGKMPVGHPVELAPDTYTSGQYFGLFKGTILPPRQLYHPVLPYRARGKLLFPLCRTCAINNLQEPCSHRDRERELSGTWCTPEVDQALDDGYTVRKLF